jgi:hypothetical protein
MEILNKLFKRRKKVMVTNDEFFLEILTKLYEKDYIILATRPENQPELIKIYKI